MAHFVINLYVEGEELDERHEELMFDAISDVLDDFGLSETGIADIYEVTP